MLINQRLAAAQETCSTPGVTNYHRLLRINRHGTEQNIFYQVINMDGIQLGDMIERNLSRPFMFMHHDNIGATNKMLNRIFFERSEGPAYLILIKGTRHMNFSDFSLYGYGSITRLSGVIGKIDGKRCMRILSDYVIAFSNKHLKGQNSGLLDGSSPEFPEVEIHIRKG